jgi:hypothetical protein
MNPIIREILAVNRTTSVEEHLALMAKVSTTHIVLDEDDKDAFDWAVKDLEKVSAAYDEACWKAETEPTLENQAAAWKIYSELNRLEWLTELIREVAMSDDTLSDLEFCFRGFSDN